MKKLSIEEKAKAYDELFVKAKQIYNKENDVLILHTVEELFPELKESEDERIRKAIKYCIKQGFIGHGRIENVIVDDCLAWLEKQGEQNTAWSEEDESILQGIWDEILANKHDAKEYEWKTYDKFLDWLKSLRPQSHWKPTKQQLTELHCVISGCSFETSILVELEENLKKLL